jgi:hypothetical protein
MSGERGRGLWLASRCQNPAGTSWGPETGVAVLVVMTRLWVSAVARVFRGTTELPRLPYVTGASAVVTQLAKAARVEIPRRA